MPTKGSNSTLEWPVAAIVEMMESNASLGMPAAVTRPVSWNTWCPQITLTWFAVIQSKIVLGFLGTFLNCSKQL